MAEANVVELINPPSEALSRLLAAASGPVLAGELRGELRARTLFDVGAATWAARRRWNRRTSGVAAVVSAACLIAGTTGLAAASALPSPAARVVDQVLHTADIDVSPSSPVPAVAGGADVSQSGIRPSGSGQSTGRVAASTPHGHPAVRSAGCRNVAVAGAGEAPASHPAAPTAPCGVGSVTAQIPVRTSGRGSTSTGRHGSGGTTTTTTAAAGSDAGTPPSAVAEGVIRGGGSGSTATGKGSGTGTGKGSGSGGTGGSGPASGTSRGPDQGAGGGHGGGGTKGGNGTGTGGSGGSGGGTGHGHGTGHGGGGRRGGDGTGGLQGGSATGTGGTAGSPEGSGTATTIP
jgi:hypothetical protein